LPIKQAVISPSALSLFYPELAIADCPRDHVAEELLGAHTVQNDFAEGHLANKLDPTGELLNNFEHLNNSRHLKPHQNTYVGVIGPLDPAVESPERVCARVLEVARFFPLQQLGATDDCGFAPFSGDVSTGRATSCARIHNRVQGTPMAGAILKAQQIKVAQS
jgi:hypothetical protein